MSEGVNIVKIIVYESHFKNLDKRDLLRFNKLCKFLAEKNIHIKRYSINHNKDMFSENEDLCCLIYSAGIENLPATYVNGRIVKIEKYPTMEDINEWISFYNFK